MSKQNITLGGVIIALILGIVGLIGGNQSAPQEIRLGGVTNYDTLQVQTLKIGTSTNVSNLSYGQVTTCGLLLSGTAQTASTTKAYDCAITGVQPGDTILYSTPTTTAPTTDLSLWLFTGVRASTTAGFVTFAVQNRTGADAVISAAAASSTNVVIFRTQSSNAGL